MSNRPAMLHHVIRPDHRGAGPVHLRERPATRRGRTRSASVSTGASSGTDWLAPSSSSASRTSASVSHSRSSCTCMHCPHGASQNGHWSTSSRRCICSPAISVSISSTAAPKKSLASKSIRRCRSISLRLFMQHRSHQPATPLPTDPHIPSNFICIIARDVRKHRS